MEYVVAEEIAVRPMGMGLPNAGQQAGALRRGWTRRWRWRVITVDVLLADLILHTPVDLTIEPNRQALEDIISRRLPATNRESTALASL
jgi:hypothetical protein